MACDHLHKRTFDNAMEKVRDDYYNMNKEFKGGLASAMVAYYDAWQSTKGWNKVNDLYLSIATALTTAGSAICKNYTTMKAGAEKFAKEQDMFLWIGEITTKEFDMEKKTFGEDAEIIIDEGKISSSGNLLKASLEKINSYVDASKAQTSSDDNFGYYSDGGVNPRATMYDAYTALDTALRNATTKFFKDFESILEADKALRDATKQESAVENSDFTNIF